MPGGSFRPTRLVGSGLGKESKTPDPHAFGRSHLYRLPLERGFELFPLVHGRAARLVHLESFPPGCRILIPRNPPAFALRSIELLGLSDRVVQTGNEDLEIERYWFAGSTMLSGCPDPSGVRWLRGKLLPEPQREAHRKIYIERSAHTRKLGNARDTGA